MLNLHRRSVRTKSVADVYAAIVGQARIPAFYSRLGVPDTIDGRFELIVLHAALVFRRLSQDPAAADFAQGLFDYMFADMDQSLREQGVGDLSVGKHVKRMAQGFYGRVVAYDKALTAHDQEELVSALARNVYGTAVAPPEGLDELVGYVTRQAAHQQAQPVDRIVAGEASFLPLLP